MPDHDVCFIVCPIGDEDSEERTRSDKLLRFILTHELGTYKIERADKISESGRITAQILELLGSAELVVVDVTGLNPNVMYELGIRHATGRPVIHMALKGQELPFDIRDFRTVFYELDLEEVEAAKEKLRGYVDSVKRKEPVLNSVASLVKPALNQTEIDIKGAIIPLHEAVSDMAREFREFKEILIAASTESASASAEQQRNEMIATIMSGVLPQAMADPLKFEQFMKVIARMPGNVSGSPDAKRGKRR